MKHVYVLTISAVIAFSSTLKAGEVFYDITFSSPEHSVGYPPATGSSPTRPSMIVFGKPIVSSSLGLLLDQPLVFNTTGNQPSFYYDQIRLNVGKNEAFYYVAFDVLTQNLIGSTNHFKVLFDTPTVRNIVFRNSGQIYIENKGDSRVIGYFSDNTLMHCEVYMDMVQEKWMISVNNNQIHSGLFKPDEDIKSIRFSLGLVNSQSFPNHSTNVGLDNIIVANYVVSKLCMPVADAGESQLAYVDENCLATVTLDGSGSYDPRGLELTYEWSWTIDGELYTANGVSPTIDIPLGEHVIELIVNNGKCDSTPSEVMITVHDDIVPELEVSVSPSVLWPPNHKMVLVTPNIVAWDNCNSEPQVALISVTSNEPDDDGGDGHTSDDILIDKDGNIYLRAERNGGGNNRLYTLTYEAMDAVGNSTQAGTTVTVPHNKGRLR